MIDRNEAQKIREIFQKTGTIAETARITGHHRTTVKRVLTRDYSLPVKRRRKASRWERRVKDLLAQNIPLALRSRKFKITPKRIHSLLREEDCELSLRQVERIVKRVSDALFSSKRHEALLRIEAFPGCWQSDYCNVYANINNNILPLNLFILSSAYSNACVGICSESQCSACFFHALEKCFEMLDGVPPVIRFDNLSAAVKFIRTKRIKTDAFSRFEIHHGFVSEFCNPYHGNEKGNVEQKVKYLRQNFFVPLPVYSSLESLNHALSEFLLDDMKRKHYCRKKMIKTLFDEEKNCFLPLQTSFDFWDVKTASVNKQGFVMYDCNYYFASIKSALKRVGVKANHESVIIMDNEEKILNYYNRIFENGVYVQNAIDLASMLARKPNALKSMLPGLTLDGKFFEKNYAQRAKMIRKLLEKGCAQ